MDTWEALYGTLTSDQVKVLLTKGFRNRLAQCPFKKNNLYGSFTGSVYVCWGFIV